MKLAKAKAKTNETFIEQASLTIVTYDHQNMFIVQATAYKNLRLFFSILQHKSTENTAKKCEYLGVLFPVSAGMVLCN
jgi:hypothetical protein